MEGYDFITPEQFITDGIPVKTGKPNPSIGSGGDAFFKTVGALSTMSLIRKLILKKVEKYRDNSSQLT